MNRILTCEVQCMSKYDMQERHGAFLVGLGGL